MWTRGVTPKPAGTLCPKATIFTVELLGHCTCRSSTTRSRHAIAGRPAARTEAGRSAERPSATAVIRRVIFIRRRIPQLATSPDLSPPRDPLGARQHGLQVAARRNTPAAAASMLATVSSAWPRPSGLGSQLDLSAAGNCTENSGLQRASVVPYPISTLIPARPIDLAYLNGERPPGGPSPTEMDVHDGVVNIKQGRTTTTLRIALESELAVLLERLRGCKVGRPCTTPT